MGSISIFPQSPNYPRLIPNYKQTERRLLSVFMSLLEFVPQFRAEFLARCNYRSGKTSQFRSAMEVSYGPNFKSDVRPDGLLYCQRGSAVWSCFVEAKSEKGKIRPEQIQNYAELAAQIGVNAIVTISNEYASSPTVLPYFVATQKRKKREIFHFSWPDIRGFIESFRETNSDLPGGEKHILMSCLQYFWDKQSGIFTYDEMPKAWPDFVESAKTPLGFNTKTQGITEIIHGWQQERRDLCAKLCNETHSDVFLRHDAGARASANDRIKFDRTQLANQYLLGANYFFKSSPIKLRILADLKSCNLSAALRFYPPEGKKAKATITWLSRLVRDCEFHGKIAIDWPGRGEDYVASSSVFLQNFDFVAEGKKEAPKEIRFIVEMHDVRKFKSRRKFIEELESMTLGLAHTAHSMGVIESSL